MLIAYVIAFLLNVKSGLLITAVLWMNESRISCVMDNKISWVLDSFVQNNIILTLFWFIPDFDSWWFESWEETAAKDKISSVQSSMCQQGRRSMGNKSKYNNQKCKASTVRIM